MNEEFIKKFRIKEFRIKDFEFWVLSVRPVQPTLGSLVLSLKRDCNSLQKLTPLETKELSTVFQTTEKILSSFIKYDKINYICLMMIDDQVHFHIIPRYQGYRQVGNVRINDKGWPGPPNITEGVQDAEILRHVKNELKKQIH